jgi:hypothetical protein
VKSRQAARWSRTGRTVHTAADSEKGMHFSLRENPSTGGLCRIILKVKLDQLPIQIRIDTPGCVKSCIIPDIVLFVNGIPLVVEAKIGDPNTANPIYEAFVQLLRYRNARPETKVAGLREGEPRLFYSNLLLVRTCGEKAEFGTIISGHEHFYAWQDIWPESRPCVHATARDRA